MAQTYNIIYDLEVARDISFIGKKQRNNPLVASMAPQASTIEASYPLLKQANKV